MTDEFQLPRAFRNTGRKYHTPDIFSGVFPDQPYRFDPETLQQLEEEAENEDAASVTESEKERSVAAQRIVDEANILADGGDSFEEWKRRAEKALSQTDISIQGEQLVPGTDESRVYWAPAPPKLEVAPAKVRQMLFPQYQSEKIDENGRLIVTAPAEPESESEEEEEEESPEVIEDRAMNQRILGRQHQSCEDLTQLMKAEIKREEMIHNKRLDAHTYRPLITPPPPPAEEEPEDGAPHTEGVALMLAPEAQRALIGWEPVNSRIITAKFITKKKDIKLNIIQCYAPTNDAEEEKKDDFYQQLQTVIDRGGAKDMTILMGDFNAKIGSDNTGYEDTMGTHGLGQMNENGERFADLCALNQLVIGGSIFPHKRIHKATWRSPDHVTENQIDHICISRKFRRSWRDVRVMRGADVSSDHHLLATTLRLRLKRHTNANNTRTRYNVGLLRNTDTQAAFRISLSNRFQPLQDLIEDSEMDIETQWEHSKKLWHDTCEEVLGKRKTQHKEWISADTIQKLEVRKEKKTALNTSRTRRAKAKAQEEYTAADREVKRSTRKDKRDYIDNLASQAEEAARQGNLKDLYQVTKKLAGKFQQTDKPVKDKNGHPLTTTEEQLKRWAEHFRELLNRPIPETPPDIPPAETELPINCDKPSKAEIRKAIMTLRNGKAAGPDEIPAEAIKADTETAVNMLHSLFSKIWEKEEVPAQWKEGIVIKLPKKGDLRDCSNYRGIMLLSVPGKVLNRILLERMREAVDPMLRDQQAGFRRNRSCADQIASLRIIVEQSLEWNSPLYINFIDYEKAFDSVDREALWKLLRHYGVPGKIISLIQCTYQDMSCRIAHAGQLSESFEVKTGVRQGCLLSPFLFLLVIDWIMKTTTAGRKNGIQWTLWTQLDDLDFADDLALLSHSHSQMQDKTTCLEATSAGTGLKINRKKTELMKINTTANTPVTVGGEPIREVESFVYLGSVVDGQGGTDRDVTARIGKARAAMVMLKNVWASKVVSIRTKLRIFNSNVKSVLLYGCETWRTTKTMQQKIQTFLNTCLRRIFNIRWPEKIRNEELWERAGQEPVAKQILRRKWGWIGHTLRKPASSTTRQALTWNPQGKRKRGRPRNSWRRDTEAELCKQGTNWTGVARLAQNRVRCRRVVDGLCSTWSQGPKRSQSMPRMLADLDDTLLVPLDFNQAMEELREQRQLMEKAKKQRRIDDATDELNAVEEEERQQQQQQQAEEAPVHVDILRISHTPKKEEELTPAEKALQAGRSYVILPKKRSAEEREWTRDIWNKWFDEVFPPTPTGSEDEDEEEVPNTDGGGGGGDGDQQREEKRKGKDAVPDILSEEIDAIEPVADTEENAEIIAILKEEVEKLTKLIDSVTPPMAFDLARRGALYRKDKKAAALEDLNYIMKHNKTHAGAYRSMAEIYRKQGDVTMAIVNFTQAIKMNPTDHDAYFQRAAMYEERGEKLLAHEDYSKCMKLMPTRTDAIIKHGMHYFQNEAHPKRALQDYSVSLAIHDGEDNIMSYLHRGILYNSLGRPEDAIPDFEAVLKLNKDIACAHVNLGLIFMTKHQNYHRAIKKFTSAIKCDPTYVRAYVCRGEAYHKIHEGQLVLELGNLELAAFCVRHASEIGQGGAVSAFGDRPTQQAAVQSFLKNYDKAIDALTQATRVKPVAPLFMLLGKTQMKAKMFKEGAASFEKALDLMRPWRQREAWPPEAAEAHFLSGMCHMELRGYLPAFNAFNNAINLDGNYAEVSYTKAILNCNEAIKLQPNSVRAYLYRGALKYHIKAFDLAIRDLSKAATIDNTCPLPYFNRAVCYQENKQYSKVQDKNTSLQVHFVALVPLTDYGIVLLLGDQLSLKVLINRGLLYFELGDYINALYDFQNAAKLSAGDHRIHHTLGLCFHKLGRLQEAVATFSQCLQLKPFFLDGLIARGNVYMDYGHEAGIIQARRDYERALRLDPLCLTARVNLAYTLQVCGKMMQAWRNFTIAITLKGNFKPALEGRAIVNLQMSNTFAAFQDISSSIHAAATAELLTNRGVINQFMNDRVNAMRDYRQAIELDPKYSLAYFNAANVYFHTRHFKQALDYYNKAIEYNPKDESALLNRAITKVLLRDSKSALEDFKAAIKLSPHSAHIYFNRANLYAAMRLYDKAEKDYTKAVVETAHGDDGRYSPWNNPSNIITFATFLRIERALFCWVNLVLVAIGVPTNVLNCVVFFRQGLRDRMNLCLFSLASVDMLFVGLYYFSGLYCLVGEFGDPELAEWLKWTLRQSMTGLHTGFMLSSGCLTAIISVEKCVCVFLPMKAATLMRTRTMAVLIASTVLCLQGLCLQFPLQMYVGDGVAPVSNRTTYRLRSTRLYLDNRLLFDFLENTVIMAVIPFLTFIVVVVATTVTVIQLKRAISWRKKSTAGADIRKEVALVKMLVVVSAIYIFTASPNIALGLARSFVHDFWFTRRYANIFLATHALYIDMGMLNSSINFFVYLARSSRLG
nr:hypothetical protein BaRGS_017980 [Batillaria attramentaria]